MPDPENHACEEDALIAALLNRVPVSEGAGGPGDDGALLKIGGAEVIACADGVVEGTHFDLEISTPGDAGWKALAANVSDIAAMGGVARYALVVLTLPLGDRAASAERPQDLAGEIYEGLGECSRRFGVAVAGGDLCTGREIAIAVSVLGDPAESGSVLFRSGAKVGDLICVTGTLGEASLGLWLAMNGALKVDGANREHPWLRRHCRPVPRHMEGVAIAKSGATAAIDISDGLLLDLARLCGASNCGARIDLDRIPGPHLSDWPGGRAPENASELAAAAAMGGGDDYELCFTIAEDSLPRLDAVWPGEVGYEIIGEIAEGTGILGPDGALFPAGWDHFSGRDAGE